MSNGSLHKILKDNDDYWPKEDYDLVLVDEAHKFRIYTPMASVLQLSNWATSCCPITGN